MIIEGPDSRISSRTASFGTGLGTINTNPSGTPLFVEGNISASGDVSADTGSFNAINNDSTVIDSNITGSFTGSFKGEFNRADRPFLFTMDSLNNDDSPEPGAGIVSVPTGSHTGNTVVMISFSSQSANGVNLAKNAVPSSSTNYFFDIGSVITLVSTSSGKFLKAKVFDNKSTHEYFRFQSQVGLNITGSGLPSVGETVELIWDNSSAVGDMNVFGTAVDATSNIIDVFIKTSSIYPPGS